MQGPGDGAGQPEPWQLPFGRTGMNSIRIVAVVARGSPVPSALVAQRTRPEVVECHTLYDADVAIRRTAATLLVYEAGLGDAFPPAETVARLRQVPCRVLTVVGGSRRSISELISIAPAVSRSVRWCPAENELLAAEVAAATGTTARASAVGKILNVLLQLASPVAIPELAYAAVLARHTLSTSRWADARGVSSSGLRARMRRLRTQSPRTVLGLLASAHILHDCIEENVKLRIATANAGLSEPAACSHLVKRATGRSVTEWRRTATYEDALRATLAMCLRRHIRRGP